MKATISSNPYQPPRSQRSSAPGEEYVNKQLLLLTISLSASCLVLTIYARFASNGWTLLSLFIPNVVMIVAQTCITVSVLRRTNAATDCVLIMLASFSLLLAVMLQSDQGDGSGVWFVYQSMIYDDFWKHELVPRWWPFGIYFKDLFLFIPCVIIWTILIIRLVKRFPLEPGRTMRCTEDA